MSASTSTYIPTPAEAAITALIPPLKRDIAQFRREIIDLDRQFRRLLLDPHRRSNDRDEQFVYKRALVTWYHDGLPRAMRDLRHRLATYWTAAPTGVAWMVVYERQRRQHAGRTIGTVKAVMERYAPEVLRMEERMAYRFQDMDKMAVLNPAWRGAQKWPLFVKEGSVITVDPKGPLAAEWLPLLDNRHACSLPCT